jgi:hypothetical protein
MSLNRISRLKALRPSKLILLFISLVILIIPTIGAAADHPCKRASIELRGDWDVVGNRGGLWALMEQTEGLQDKSVLGMQIDGKLARLVGQFEAMCEGEKKPTKQLFNSIANLLGDARTIWNPRTSGEEIIKLLNTLNKTAETLLLKIK